MARIVHIYGAPSKQPLRGVGDWLENKLHPIAAAIHWPCLDESRKELRPESPCAKIRDGFNRLLPSKVTKGNPEE